MGGETHFQVGVTSWGLSLPPGCRRCQQGQRAVISPRPRQGRVLVCASRRSLITGTRSDPGSLSQALPCPPRNTQMKKIIIIIITIPAENPAKSRAELQQAGGGQRWAHFSLFSIFSGAAPGTQGSTWVPGVQHSHAQSWSGDVLGTLVMGKQAEG